MSRAGSTHSGGFVNAGGWGTRKIARQFHAASTRRDKNTRHAWKCCRSDALTLLTGGTPEVVATLSGEIDTLFQDQQIPQEKRKKIKKSVFLSYPLFAGVIQYIPNLFFIHTPEEKINSDFPTVRRVEKTNYDMWRSDKQLLLSRRKTFKRFLKYDVF